MRCFDADFIKQKFSFYNLLYLILIHQLIPSTSSVLVEAIYECLYSITEICTSILTGISPSSAINVI